MRRRPTLLRPVSPNIGIEIAYRRELLALIDEMHADVARSVTAEWVEPEMAHDDWTFSPARALIYTMRNLGKKWLRRFDLLAPEIAARFARGAAGRSDAAFMAALKKAGFAIPFKMTPKVTGVVEASVAENVALIRSIPAQYLTQVEGSVMRAVQVGGDVGGLVKDLRRQTGVTRRRAALIARDQNSKATATIVRARQQEAGITQAIWRHSGGGKHPRPSHEKAGRDRVVFDVTKGWYDPDAKQRVWPGTLINCRCISVPVMPWETVKTPA